jgi:hypothetical protein
MTGTNQLSLEDVLDMLLLAYDAPTPDAVADFAERYPAHRTDLILFAADWAGEAHLPPSAALDEQQEGRVFARAQSFLQNELFEQAGPGQMAAPTETLYDLAKLAGVSLRDVARVSGLDLGLVTKLNRRAIRPAGVRRHISRSIGSLLRIDPVRVARSWSGPQQLGAAAFLPSEAGRAFEQEDFDVAVSNSSLTEAQKSALLCAD